MKTIVLFCFTISIHGLLSAQQVWQVPVIANDVYLRSATALDSVVLNITEPGVIVSKFDGYCISSAGDRIVFATNDIRNWETNDGNTNVNVYNSAYPFNGFSHTRVFMIEPGIHTYYAIAHNYVDISGTGHATIYGHLTVEFLPESNATHRLTGSGWFGNIHWVDSTLPFNHMSIEAPTAGYIALSFSGKLEISNLDQVIVSSNLSNSWSDYPENIPIITTELRRKERFVHRKLYAVSSGTYEVYGLLRKIQGQIAEDWDYVYGTLTAEFIPGDTDDQIEAHTFSQHQIISGPQATIGQLHIDAPAGGKVLLEFTGYSNSSLDDRFRISMTEHSTSSDPVFYSDVQPTQEDCPYNMISISGLMDVSPGTYTFDLNTLFDAESTGTGLAEISGLFSARFIADPVSTGIHNDINNTLNVTVYPNPTQGMIYGTIDAQTGPCAVSIFNTDGRLISEKYHAAETTWAEDMSMLEDGAYIIRIAQGGKVSTQRIVKTSR